MGDLEDRLCSENSGIDGVIGDVVCVSENEWFGFFKRYFIDTSAAWVFYAPIMGCTEYFVVGMGSGEVVKSRVFSACVQAVSMRPYGMFREWWAHYWAADLKSSRVRKLSVEVSAMLMQQVPLYSLTLYCSGASWQEIGTALPVGICIGAVSARPYGYFLDNWRKLWGAKPVLDE